MLEEKLLKEWTWKEKKFRGWEVLTFNLPNGIKLSGEYDLGSIKPSEIKISKDVNVGNQKVNLSLKSDVVSGGKTAQVGVKIPFVLSCLV